MGGHGGLNILPQKRWNVYNRDNRLKVSQDEAKAREKEQAEEEAAALAESEFRHQRLLSRARQRAGEAGDVQAIEHAQQQPEVTAAGALTAGDSNEAKQLQHINFWREDEVKLQAQHPEVEAAKREDARKRGKQDFLTSDAKFDERFQFGYGVKDAQPWWTQRPQPGASQGPDPLLPSYQAASSGAALQGCQQHGQVTLSSSRQSAGNQGSLQLTAALQQPTDLSMDQDAQRKTKKRKRGRTNEEESSEDEEVAAAKQFLLRALGDQAPAALLGASNASNGSSSSSSSSSDASESSSDSGDSSDSSSGSRKRRKSQRTARDGSHRKGSKVKRSKDQLSKERKRKHRKDMKSRSGKKERSKDKHRRHSKDSSGRHKRDNGGVKSGSSAALARLEASFKSVEELRAERVAREAAERTRASRVLVGATDGPSSDIRAQYNSGFGYAAAIEKRRR